MPSPHPFPVREPGFTQIYVHESGLGTPQSACPQCGGSGRRESEGACGSNTKCLSHQRTRRDSEKRSTTTSTTSRATASADFTQTGPTTLPQACSSWRGGRSTRCPTETRRCHGSTALLATRFERPGGRCGGQRLCGRRSTANPDIPNPDPTPWSFTMSSRRNWSVLSGTLGSNDQEILRLRAYEDLSIRQIAIVLGCSPETAKKRCSRAMTRLRTAVDRSGRRRSPTRSRAIPEGGDG